MTTRKYFGTDGVRGLVGEFPITPEFALKLGWAAGKVLSKSGTKKVIIGKDTRISGYLLETSLEAGLIAAGIDVRVQRPGSVGAHIQSRQLGIADHGGVVPLAPRAGANHDLVARAVTTGISLRAK